ncbi:MAG: hypothetical protein JNG84_09800 [Archangium sp.]|nr:hypothetical protein [Archangium sp.]
MKPLTADELAAIERLKASLHAPAKPAEGVRPERFSDFAIGMSDDGELLTVPSPEAPPDAEPSGDE